MIIWWVEELSYPLEDLHDTHAATCDRVVLVFSPIEKLKSGRVRIFYFPIEELNYGRVGIFILK